MSKKEILYRDKKLDFSEKDKAEYATILEIDEDTKKVKSTFIKINKFTKEKENEVD